MKHVNFEGEIEELKLMEPEFTNEYLKSAYRRFKQWSEVFSEDDIALTGGEKYRSWFDHSFHIKDRHGNIAPTAKLTPDGRFAYRGVLLGK